MLKKVVRAGLILGVCLEVHGQPASQTYTFCQEGFSEGAFISGSFTGADSDSNGQLAFDEVTDAALTFSGNSAVGPLSFTFADFYGVVYDLDGGPLGDGEDGDVEGIGAAGAAGVYKAGPGPASICPGIDCATVSDGSNSDTSQQLVSINSGSCGPATPVPTMPFYLLLALSGLLGLSGMRKLK